PVMAPSCTDQTPGRPSQPVRSLPLNRNRKPGSSAAAAAAGRPVSAVAASASKTRLPQHHRPAFTMLPLFLVTGETLPRCGTPAKKPSPRSMARSGAEEPQVDPDPGTQAVRRDQLDAFARGPDVGDPIETAGDRGHRHDVAD